jgi:hypothetical protein
VAAPPVGNVLATTSESLEINHLPPPVAVKHDLPFAVEVVSVFTNVNQTFSARAKNNIPSCKVETFRAVIAAIFVLEPIHAIVFVPDIN